MPTQEGHLRCHSGSFDIWAIFFPPSLSDWDFYGSLSILGNRVGMINSQALSSFSNTMRKQPRLFPTHQRRPAGRKEGVFGSLPAFIQPADVRSPIFLMKSSIKWTEIVRLEVNSHHSEDRAGRFVGIEVKCAASLQRQDFRGLGTLTEISGRRFVRGVILYIPARRPFRSENSCVRFPFSALDLKLRSLPHNL